MSDDQKPGSQKGASDTASDNNQDADDLWAAAMAEQGVEPEADESETVEEATKPTGTAGSGEAQSAEAGVFQSFDQGSGNTREARDLAVVMDIPVKLSVELGRTRITIKQLLELAQGSVVELDGLAGEPMDIMINGYLVAQGEVVVVDDKYGIRITEIVTPSERVQKLNR
ncbi:flagellar motor switch protein FliN [Salinicola sp. LHM]|jgi:flagellar motor switch protein FliN/FliY|uniref:flagellar motor switch protein FliN n=1 Tax=Salinicola TaxID=404432 RepID=UPI0008DCBC77|nr:MULTISPECIES: flagellar motor switch protein FliN [Salinicola]MEC8916836.1 flagellar motor switch protein FliN [Pseudomonadota bacterium]MDF3917577.1 flagellar motor switch protein FliN [Salinicola salarius]MED5500064.1 flagellar motor switch protein FliN [Pseudomonadota bacterium]OHZ02617.1 flagellar motor switch protein FliN [Salinicola sp. MIT1003]WQH31494.1 flagellar motor switch protein FliN [Salinicola sp. LHM]